MADSNEAILDRIRKLLALGESDNPHEAALAMARAAALMEKHQIAEADVDGGGDEDVIEETFGFPGSHRSGDLKTKSTWQGELAAVVSRAFGCAAVWRTSRQGPNKRARIVIAGRKQDVAAAIAAKDFCHREIDRLTAKFSNGQGRSFGVAFRVGAVQAIREAIDEERAALRAEMQGQVSETALVIVDTRSDAAMESFGEVRKSRSNLEPDALAFMQGRSAGQSVWSGTKQRIEG